MPSTCAVNALQAAGLAAAAWYAARSESALQAAGRLVRAGAGGLLAACALAAAGERPPPKEFPLQFRAAAVLRTPMLVFFVIPMSAVLRTMRTAYRLVAPLFHRGTHASRVAEVVAAVQAWNAGGRRGRMRTARPNWLSMSTRLGSNKGNATLVRTLHLNRILKVDADALTVTAEPGVTFGQLARALLPQGLMLKVHVEMDSITIGGATLGMGFETTSHRHGFIFETVTEWEMVTAAGDVLTVTADSDPDLFRALPWSHGTLGFLTAVTVGLARTKPYVRLRYVPATSAEELAASFQAAACSEDPPDFVEATFFARDRAVLQLGTFHDAPASAAERRMVNHFNRWYKPFVHRWVESFLEKGAGEELIPLWHYMHRAERSIFWELEDMIPFSNNPLYRLFWGWLGPPEVSLLKLMQGPVIRRASIYAHAVQESIMPADRVAEGVARFDEWFGVYPLLLMPMRVWDRGTKSGFLHPRAGLVPRGASSGLWVDVGAYGVPRDVKAGRLWDAKKAVRAMEHWTRDAGGWQACYTDLFATRKEFRAMFDHSLLDACRARLGAEDAFPEPYDKVRPEPGLIDLSEEERAEGGPAAPRRGAPGAAPGQEHPPLG